MIKKFRPKVFEAPLPEKGEIPVAPQAPLPPPGQLRRLEDKSDSAESVISAGSSFKGEIRGRAGVRILGEIVGNIRCEGLVRVEEAGKVKGKIESPYVILGGELEGDIFSAQHVELRSTAKMRGNIKTALLAIAEGCFIEGQIEMGSPEDQPLKFAEKRKT
jgi:cytoskeletal protein CcmA (bactofilin family)